MPFPKDNPGKIAPNHEAQTNIYRMIIQSVFGLESRQISSSILYSSSDVSGENLRFSAPYKKLEKEIVNVRNLIVGTEHSLSVGNDETVWYIFDQLFDLENYNRVPKFFTDKLLSIKKILEELSSIEKKYFFQFIRFISTELYLQKIGDEGFETQSGVSALWTSEFAERKESFNLLAGLEIMEIKESETDMKICFSFSDDDMPFSNFREGEICILYPKDNDVETILTNQILKGTVAEINSDNIIVRFRYKQKNKEYLTSHKNWVIEHDKLDHTYNNMYKSLYSFISEPKIKRDLLLGLSCPKYSDIQCYIKKTDQLVLYKQRHIIDKVLAAKDYFLLVGPPGTGKTSIYVKLILEELYKNRTTTSCSLHIPIGQ
ncbi:MAG: hypothetical protein ACLVKO_11840 [Dysgonomonas sp.]